MREVDVWEASVAVKAEAGKVEISIVREDLYFSFRDRAWIGRYW